MSRVYPPYAHAKAIGDALRTAAVSRTPRYVLPSGNGYGWEVVTEQPDARWSHWRANADGSLQAHVETNPNGAYFYEYAEGEGERDRDDGPTDPEDIGRERNER